MNNIAGYIGLIVTVLIALLGLLYRIGKMEQSINDKVDNLKEDVGELKKEKDENRDTIAKHMADTTLHVNKELQERIQADRQRFQDNTERKLDELTKLILEKKP